MFDVMFAFSGGSQNKKKKKKKEAHTNKLGAGSSIYNFDFCFEEVAAAASVDQSSSDGILIIGEIAAILRTRTIWVSLNWKG